MRYLILGILLLLSFTQSLFAYQIKMEILPCQHIVIRNAETNEILEISTKQELKRQVYEWDSFLFKQIKYYIKQSGLTNLSDIKMMLESKDWIKEKE